MGESFTSQASIRPRGIGRGPHEYTPRGYGREVRLALRAGGRLQDRGGPVPRMDLQDRVDPVALAAGGPPRRAHGHRDVAVALVEAAIDAVRRGRRLAPAAPAQLRQVHGVRERLVRAEGVAGARA